MGEKRGDEEENPRRERPKRIEEAQCTLLAISFPSSTRSTKSSSRVSSTVEQFR